MTLGPPEVELDHQETCTSEFTVRFRRQYNGIPYDGGGALVSLAAEDGKLLVLSAGLDSPTPASTAVNVDEGTAKASALGFASKVAPSLGLTTAWAKLMIVVPNSYWVGKGLGAEEDATGPGRPGW